MLVRVEDYMPNHSFQPSPAIFPGFGFQKEGSLERIGELPLENKAVTSKIVVSIRQLQIQRNATLTPLVSMLLSGTVSSGAWSPASYAAWDGSSREAAIQGEPDHASGCRGSRHSNMAVRQKSVPKIEPRKWKHGLKPVIPWWFNFDPYPYVTQLMQKADSPSRQITHSPRQHGSLWWLCRVEP